jgi:hypothetical protein
VQRERIRDHQRAAVEVLVDLVQPEYVQNRDAVGRRLFVQSSDHRIHVRKVAPPAATPESSSDMCAPYHPGSGLTSPAVHILGDALGR